MRYAVFRDGAIFKSFVSKIEYIFDEKKDADFCAMVLNNGAVVGSRFEVREVE